MKKNTVVLSVKGYERLRNIERTFTENGVLARGFSGGCLHYTQDEAIEGLLEKNDQLFQEIYDLKVPKDGITIEDVKSMSLWEFYKWKKNNKNKI